MCIISVRNKDNFLEERAIKINITCHLTIYYHSKVKNHRKKISFLLTHLKLFNYDI